MEGDKKLHLFSLFTSLTINVLSRDISNWCLCPFGKMTMTRVNSSDLSLFGGGGFVPSSGSASASAWNRNCLMVNVLPMMQSAFVLMYDFLNNNLRLGYTLTDGVHTYAGHL